MPWIMLAAAVSQPVGTPALWNPTAPYVITGQDEPGYRSWYLSASWRGPWVKSFNDYLVAQGVGGVVPTWQLLRTASDWFKCGDNAFEMPPAAEWPKLANSLRFVRDVVIPTVGPVEAVSVYRNPTLNSCAGGAPESAHKHYSAIDLVPLRPTTREGLMRTLCTAHGYRGPDYGVGLGFYAFLRFHVDTTKYRRWNMDPAVANQCPPIVRPADIATVAQPQAPAPVVAPETNAAAAAPGTPSPAPERGQPQR